MTMGSGADNLPVLLGLSKAERFWLWRRRSGTRLAEAARAVGMTGNRLSEIERGDRDGEDELPEVILEEGPDEIEACVLLRRREKMTLEDVAAAVGVSRIAVWGWENGKGDASRLVRYWASRARSRA